MSLQRQSVDVPLASMQQQLPATAPPVGRLSSIFNAIARKFRRADGVATLRVEKRAGFAQLPTAVVRDPTDGSIAGNALVGSKVLSALKDRLVMMANNWFFALSEANVCLESTSALAPTATLRQTNVNNGGGDISNMPDSARVGSITAHAWTATKPGSSASMIKIVDDDGTVILNPTAVAALGPTQTKVVTDGSRFWLFVLDPPTGVLFAYAFDTNGINLGVGNLAALPNYFDVTTDRSTTAVRLVVKDPASAALKLHQVTWTGAAVAISAGTVVAGTLASTGRVAFLRNATLDANYYIGAIDGAGPYDYRVYQVNGAGANLHTYAVALAQAVAPVEIAGMVETGANNIIVALSFLDVIPDVRRNYTTIYSVTFAGVSTLRATRRSLTLVSRSFPLGVQPMEFAAMYYQPDPGAASATQGTFFLVSLCSTTVTVGPWGQVCGRWEGGTAYGDWQTAATPTSWMALSSPQIADDGGVHTDLSYRATSTTKRVQVLVESDIIYNAWFDQRANTVGVRDYSIGPDHGQAVEADGELLLPGTQAFVFDGTNFTESGIPLVSEFVLTTGLVGAAGGALTALQQYQYVLVDEWTDANGNRVRSPAGPPLTITLTGANQSVIITALNTHVSLKTNLVHSVYRTAIVNQVQSTAHYKVTNDLSPIYNIDANATWTFTDTMADAVAAVNEQLYTDKQFVDRFPAPPFSVGCVAKGRVFVIGPDGSIWFSGEKTEGDPYWFTPLFRIPIPSNEKLTQVKALDNFLIVFTERTSAYSIPISQLPDATGNGPIPRAEKLPFTSGCTGFAATIETGVAYSSAQGGIWLITRALGNVFIGADVQDSTAASTITAMVADKNEKLYVSTTAGRLLVFDEISGAWFTWSMINFPLLLTLHKGQVVYLSTETVATVWRQTPGTFSDVSIAPASTAIQMSMTIGKVHLGSVRGFKRIWNVQIEGTYLGPHSLIVSLTLYPDDRNTTVTSTFIASPVAGQPYVFEFAPAVEQVSGVAIDITEGQVVDSAGFALEMLGFEVGIEKGLGRLPIARRIPGL